MSHAKAIDTHEEVLLLRARDDELSGQLLEGASPRR